MLLDLLIKIKHYFSPFYTSEGHNCRFSQARTLGKNIRLSANIDTIEVEIIAIPYDVGNSGKNIRLSANIDTLAQAKIII